MNKNEECKVKTVKVKQGKKHHLNILMTICVILLMKIVFTNLVWHEVIGLGVFIMFLLHHIYNFKYTVQIMKKFFSNKVKPTVKIGLILDLALFLNIIGLVFTAVNISNILFRFSGLDYLWPELALIHKGLANLMLILIALHIGLHWSSVIHQVRRAFNIYKENFIRKLLIRLIVLIISIYGIFSFGNLGINDKISDSVNGFVSLAEKLIFYDDEGNFKYIVGETRQVSAITGVFQVAESEDEEDEEDEKDDEYHEPEKEDDERDEVDGTTSSTTKAPEQNIDGTTSSTTKTPGQIIDGTTSSTINQQGLIIDGKTSSTTNTEGSVVDGVTSSTIDNAMNQPKYSLEDDPVVYVRLVSEYIFVIGLFVGIAYYSARVMDWYHKKDWGNV